MKRRTFLLFLLAAPAAKAHSYKFGTMAIGHAWARATTEAETSAMMPFLNGGAKTDYLISATSEAADKIELRDGATLVSEFEIVPQKPFPMRSAAMHLQLIGLKKPLAKGDHITLTLKFKLAGETTIELHINDQAGE
jgi:periplasmic copper chaperone A